MKASFLLFCTLFIIEYFVNANNDYNKLSMRKDLYQMKKEQYMNGPKSYNKRFFKVLKVSTVEPRTKQYRKDDGYTFFPPLVKSADIPSSPYFPEDPHVGEPKLRVKKVLPDFFWNPVNRKKRSPEEKDKADKAEGEKKEAKETKKVEKSGTSGDVKKDDKESATAANVANPKADTRRSGGKGSRELESRRLIAGEDAKIENYPYVVSIQKDGEHWCAGAILNQRLVITTANCVWKSSRMTRMMIRAGSRHLQHGGQLVGISEVLKHPGWSIRKGPDHDLALLLTTDFVKFSHSCHAVDLPNRIMMPVFEDAWVTSWGADRRDGVYEKRGLTLQVYHGRLISLEKCNNVTMRFGVMVTPNFICLEQTGHRAPCTRDTGAPAVSDGVLWGLASWGIRKMCGTERFPAMYSYVASQSNMDFIINGTRYMMSDERLSPFLDRYPFERARNNSILRI